MIESIPQQIWFVINCNHPRELDQEILDKLRELQKRGAVVCNQAVLLKGVNNDIDTLQLLSETLVDNGIVPYYLHQLDRVQGSAHFEVPEIEGLRLIEKLSARMPGYAVPKFVREIPGEPGKTPLISKFGILALRSFNP
jgi:L-lysine 2,3-aminomutase